mgnify:CR=1 FL=1
MRGCASSAWTPESRSLSHPTSSPRMGLFDDDGVDDAFLRVPLSKDPTIGPGAGARFVSWSGFRYNVAGTPNSLKRSLASDDWCDN